MQKDNDIYVVYGTDYETEFGHKYFNNKKQAESYKAYKEKTIEFDFEKYHIEKIKIEDESIDYNKIKLFSTVSLEFDNYGTDSLSVEECKEERQIKYFSDTEENKLDKKIYFQVVIGEYQKPKASINYEFCIEDESEIEKILPKLEELNDKIIQEATILCKAEMSKNIMDDSDNDFIVSRTLDTRFKKEVEMIING